MEEFRKARAEDLPYIMAFVKRAVAHMDSKGIFQWDETYPTEAIVKGNIDRGDTTVYTVDSIPMAMISLDCVCDEEYLALEWTRSENFGVYHRLCVDPSLQGKGIGRRLAMMMEEKARAMGLSSIHLDAFTQNPAALHLYESMGFEPRGLVMFRSKYFRCYEKLLD